MENEITDQNNGCGSVEVYCENNSSDGYEIYIDTIDFDPDSDFPGFASAIMDPDEARELARRLIACADECERLNLELFGATRQEGKR